MGTLSTPAVPMERCDRCAQPISAGMLACPQCHALVHGEELERLSASAKELESAGDFRSSREVWAKALPLLPYDSLQAEWIRGHLYKLDLVRDSGDASKPRKYEWAKKLGPLGPIAVVLAKSKVLLSLFKLKFLLSLGAFLGFYWTVFGAKFGVGFVVLIFIHEMGHYIDIRRRGLSAEMPTFLPGFGAFVRWQASGVSKETRAAVSLAGPLAGMLAALACASMWWYTKEPLWSALAWSGAWLNLMNLIPVWILDGGQATLALSKTQRFVLLGVSLALWLFLQQNLFVLVAGGMAWRLFTKDTAPNPSRAIVSYYAVVLGALGVIMALLPAQNFAGR